MLHLNKIHLFDIHRARELKDLEKSLQLALELEHSTIPPYLTAMYSLIPGQNDAIRKIILSVAAEEMLHMSIVANIINAIGGKPAFNKPNFIPNYPGQLPLGIAGGLHVGLEKFSKYLIKEKFMLIEEPEQPIDMPNGPEDIQDHEHTIGAFYLGLQRKLKELLHVKLPGAAELQVCEGFPPDQLFPIYSTDDAIRAIDFIIEQGEGTSISPLDSEGDLAHYYKFEEIWYGKKIVPDPIAPKGYSFSGDEIPFDENGVYPIYPNTKSSMLPNGSKEHELLKKFNGLYSHLLNELHITFNGKPAHLNNTFALMGEISKAATAVCECPFPGKPGYHLGLPFEYDNHLFGTHLLGL
jgi:rubrerythrin